MLHLYCNSLNARISGFLFVLQVSITLGQFCDFLMLVEPPLKYEEAVEVRSYIISFNF